MFLRRPACDPELRCRHHTFFFRTKNSPNPIGQRGWPCFASMGLPSQPLITARCVPDSVIFISPVTRKGSEDWMKPHAWPENTSGKSTTSSIPVRSSMLRNIIRISLGGAAAMPALAYSCHGHALPTNPAASTIVSAAAAETLAATSSSGWASRLTPRSSFWAVTFCSSVQSCAAFTLQ